MIPLNYHHLYYFWKTAKAGSIAKARRELMIAQPTLSLQLRELEKFFGRDLLRRSRQGVALTAEGRVAFEYCERIFSQGEELAKTMIAGGAAPEPLFRIGLDRSVPREVTVGIVDYLRKQHTALRVTIVGGTTAELRDRLRRHTLDLVLSSTYLAALLGKEFVSKQKARLRVVFVAQPALAKRLPPFPACLNEAPLLLRTAEDPVRKDLELYLQRNGVTPNPVAEIDDDDLLRFLALRGSGVVALDILSARTDIRRKRLVPLSKKATGVRKLIWFNWGKRPKLNPLLESALHDLTSRYRLSQ
ncbi:MAG: hypothetical protein AUJ52_10060 [Elusimicrobia bacterium CG1_02_63_36]|nr:MAG: hypothetical protein AUJ52_10060 [Elusimicrobia bacterium CG1_02_63_36]